MGPIQSFSVKELGCYKEPGSLCHSVGTLEMIAVVLIIYISLNRVETLHLI